MLEMKTVIVAVVKQSDSEVVGEKTTVSMLRSGRG